MTTEEAQVHAIKELREACADQNGAISIADAIAKERERCIKIIDKLVAHEGYPGSLILFAQQVEKRIRGE